MSALSTLLRSCNYGRDAAVSAMLLLSFVAGSIGVPVLAPVEKDLSAPFPCQYRSCGCRDAASCWKSCCCFTHEQKLAWAKQHHVEVPAHAVVQTVVKKKASCGKSCCSQKKEEPPQTIAKTLSPLRRVVLADYHQCRTGSPLVVVLSQALPPNVPAALPQPSLTCECVVSLDLIPESISYRPPSPPPKA